MTSIGMVTGAGSGMGAALAARLVGDVDVSILADRNAEAVASATANVSTGQHNAIHRKGPLIDGPSLWSCRESNP
jgi:NAD(P)-dependent dehydrogenase (short-subunit alcohol dehydrogenase family)